ncbi:MAG TPA: BamA/TamA family outer membrane protein [Bacteroidia bacterium]|nr:BamA/TamA family outer membrane protein [Bacteroidia bacterium]
MGDNAILLNKNIIKVDNSSLKEGIRPIIKQKPNRKILGVFRFHLGVYNLANRWHWGWVKRTIGEEPVLLDTALTTRSVKQIKQYMENIGYYNAEVRDSIAYVSKHKANVIYYITENAPYKVKSFFFSIKDPVIDSIVNAENKNTLIHTGDNYDTGIIQKERERITTILKNTGFYAFNQQYIAFKIDSSLKSKSVNIYMTVSNPFEIIKDTIASVKSQNHIQYSINKIYVRTDYDPLNINERVSFDTLNYNNYYFLSSSGHFNFRPSPLARNIFFKSGELYRLSDHENTYRSLGDLGNFRFINIKFETDSEALMKNENKLNCYVLLTPLSKQSYKIELEGTHNGGNLGALVNIIYLNKNTFRGAETFDFRIKTAFENLKNAPIEENKKILFFNTYEFGPEARLNIPRVVSLFRPKNKSVISSTELIMSYNLQQRPEFYRRIADFSAGAIYKFSNYFRFQAYPAEVNFVSVKPDPVFQQKLEEIGDPALTSSYEDHLITDGRYSLIFTSQELNRAKSFIFLRLNFEAAGNSLRLKDELTGRVAKKDSSYTFLNNHYAQYIKPDADFRFYFVPDANNTVVYRLAGGIGVPYLNSRSLPFEKSFYAGGSNDLRAFFARTIGPGSYFKETIQQTGEIKINSNIEYRFDIFKILQGAFFVDAGNVWLTHEDANRPGGKFEWNKFYNEIAIGAGYGFRFNFTFFIFRYDLGYKFRDPTHPENDGWVYDDLHLFQGVTSNFGIGYPF